MTNTRNQMDYSGWVKRIDLLLRGYCPLARTRIFKCSPYEYYILVQNEELDLRALAQDFDRSIRYAGVPVSLTSEIPKSYQQELSPILDPCIPCDLEGLPLTAPDVAILIEAKFPQVSVSEVSIHDSNNVSTVRVCGQVDTDIKQQVLLMLSKLNFPTPFVIEDGAVQRGKMMALQHPVFYIPSSNSISDDLPFLRRDEELWFDNLTAIYAGDFSKDDLPFFSSSEVSCFVDLSAFANINLRNHLLLYDAVYCALPSRDGLDKCLEEQKVTREDLIYLASKGRIKILVTQPETMMDKRLLRDIYEANPSAVVSRRAVAALCAIDIVSIDKKYMFNDPSLASLVLPLSNALSESLKIDAEALTASIMWPKMTLRSSFGSLNNASSKGLSKFGVNNIILQSFPKESRKKIEFEFVMNAEAIHIAHALDATYFPFKPDQSGYTDRPYALMMGNALNFYKCANASMLDEFLDVEKRKTGSVPLLDPVSVFEVNEYLSLTDIENEASDCVLRKGMRTLFDEISSLPESERQARILDYNKRVEAIMGREGYRGLAIDFATDTVGLCIPFLSVAKRLLNFLAGKAKQEIPIVGKVRERIAEIRYSQVEKRHISLLTKLNRVARLRKEYH